MSYTQMQSSSALYQGGWRLEQSAVHGYSILPIHFVWVLATSVSIVTSRYLLETLNWHYPFHLLSLQLFCSVVANVGLLRRAYDDEESQLPEVGRLRQILSDIAFAVSMPLFVQAVFHAPNMPTLCMLLLLAFLPSLTLSLGDSNVRFVPGIFSLAIFILGAFVLVADDYRFDIITTALAIPAILLLGLQPLLEPPDCGNAMQNPRRNFQKTAMSLVVSLCLCYKFEIMKFGFAPFLELDTLQWTAPMALFSNLIFTMVAFWFGGDIVSPLRVDSQPTLSLNNENNWLSLTLSMAVTSITAASALLIGPTTSISGVQVAAYFAVVLAVFNPNFNALVRAIPRTGSAMRSVYSGISYHTGLDSLGKHAVLPTTETTEIMNNLDTHDILNQRLYNSDQCTRSNFSKALCTIILLLTISTCWPTIMQKAYLHHASPPSNAPILDLSYTSPRDLDIVISTYQESVPTLQRALHTLLSIPKISTRNPRIHIYTKSELGIDDSLSVLNATTITHLPNIGREGETYLHHILTNWDTLASQTIFLQAELHNPSEISTRLENYLDTDTGMLSLGFSGHSCACGSCSDSYGWHDSSGILETMYTRANNATCDSLLLSYKGQFVASAKRIRGIGRSVYEELETAFTDMQGWAHGEEYLQGRRDSVDRPFFGYTMERLWGVVLQCTSMRIARDCPSLAGGWRRGGDRGDCQCFD